MPSQADLRAIRFLRETWEQAFDLAKKQEQAGVEPAAPSAELFGRILAADAILRQIDPKLKGLCHDREPPAEPVARLFWCCWTTDADGMAEILIRLAEDKAALECYTSKTDPVVYVFAPSRAAALDAAKTIWGMG